MATSTGNWAVQMVIFTLLLTFLEGGRICLIRPAQAAGQHESSQGPTEEDQADFKAWIAGVAERVKANGVDPKDVKHGAFFHKDATVLALSGDTTFFVDTAGSAQFRKIQDAVDAIPSDKSRTNRVIIKLEPGIYYEQIVIGKDKPYVTLQGSGQWNTKISWKEDLGQSGSDITDAACQVAGDFFTAIDISFENTSPAPPSGAEKKQATALAISGDSAAFLRVGFFGYQDTLYDRLGRHYFQNSYITGSIDFIYGDGQSLYANCELHVEPVDTGSLTAQKRKSTSETSGFSFVGCAVTGQGNVYLGRAWGPASRTVFSHTYLADIVNPVGWNNWGLNSRDKTIYYGEYENYGPGSSLTGRTDYSRELTSSEAAPFQDINFIDGYSWLPQSGIGV